LESVIIPARGRVPGAQDKNPGFEIGRRFRQHRPMSHTLIPVRFGAALRTTLVAGALATVAVQADVRLHPLFSDHTVLQQGKAVPIWGWADAGEKVTVEFGQQTVSTVTDDNGRWQVNLKPLKATAASRTLRVSGKNALSLQDVVVGEVWICSGQSNMEWPLRASANPEADIRASANPLLRLFTVQKATSQIPLRNFANPAGHNWKLAEPESTSGFSAVAYYFGRDLQAALGVPVGLIHTSWGGSPAEAWTSPETLRDNHVYARDILSTVPNILRNRKAAMAKWEIDRDTAVAAGKPAPGKPFAGWLPSDLYNAMIEPLLPYGVGGAIWYQGESNASRAWQYRSLFADMITDWRQAFCQGDFPFLAVQLAPWDKNRKRSIADITQDPVESDWAELREAQNHAAKVLRKVGVAVITDVGDKDDIHPTQKQPVGARLALLAQRIGYNRKNAAHGPVFQSQSVSGNSIVLNFGETAGGLKSVDGAALTGFAIAGEDRKWHWAKAEIRGSSQVVVSCPAVEKPVAVRYGWSDFPVVNLADKGGLPASPFRSDKWPATTDKP
jgi:sialate O-acetylesterase